MGNKGVNISRAHLHTILSISSRRSIIHLMINAVIQDAMLLFKLWAEVFAFFDAQGT